MIHHICMDCQRGFVATSLDEAKEEFKKQLQGGSGSSTFEEAVECNEVAYAQYCPYCGGQSIEPV